MMKKKTAHDYKFIRLLGEGSFSSVYLAVDADVTISQKQYLDSSQNESGIELEAETSVIKPFVKSSNKIRKYAIKVCQKSYIKRQGKQAAIMREKEILNMLNQHPNQHFIKLHYTFQDIERLYFVMTYAENGDLLTYMQEHPLSLLSVRKYTLQLITALEHLHKLNIVHRDMKPENILLDDRMNIMITDFGSAQIYPKDSENLRASSERRNSFVGTAQYVSPEMLKNRQATNKSDLWALGVIIYQMITNIMPFNAPNEYLIYQKIQSLDYSFPDDFDPNARDLVSSLIKLEPNERLGATDNIQNNGYHSIREHSFFCMDYDCSTGAVTLHEHVQSFEDTDLVDVDKINPGLDESQQLRLLTIG